MAHTPSYPPGVADCEEILLGEVRDLSGEEAAEYMNSVLAMLNNVAAAAGMAHGKYERGVGRQALSEHYYGWMPIREALDVAHDAYREELWGDESDVDEDDDD